MQGHPTFSLTTILNTNHMQPQVYQHMIHEIKSPLQEQSFALTNDQSRIQERIPKRPNIPPAVPKSPLAHFYDHQLSRTYDSLSMDMSRIPHQPQKPVKDEVIETVSSPFEHSININRQPSGPAVWCGNPFSKLLRQQQVQSEIIMPVRTTNYKRKPIFYKKEEFQSPSFREEQKKPHKSLQESRLVLERVDEPELASFLQLMGTLEKELRQIGNQKAEIKTNLQLIYQRLSAQTSYTAQVAERNNTYQSILKRLHARNTGEVIKKVLGKKDRRGQQEGEKQLEGIFTRLSNIQVLISQFIHRENSLDFMSTVFEFIDKNFVNELTFKDQLIKLYSSLSIELYTDGIQLIWQSCDLKKLTKSQFIEGLCLNSYVVREKGDFEEEMKMKGFKRNEN